MGTKIERLTIPGPAGVLEALLESTLHSLPCRAALVCHPHPLHGGTMHNKVVFRAAKAAIQAGLPALRFNFRGVEKSEGQFSDGIGEREDVRAAIDFLEDRFQGVAVCLIGFSFGAWVGLSVGAEDKRVCALIGLGLPASSAGKGFLRNTTKPKLLISGTQDAFGPRDHMEALYAAMREPKRLHWVEGADHFFTGKLDEVQLVIRAFLEEILSQQMAGKHP